MYNFGIFGRDFMLKLNNAFPIYTYAFLHLFTTLIDYKLQSLLSMNKQQTLVVFGILY